MSQLSPGTGWPERQLWQDTLLSPRKSLRAPHRAGSQLHAGVAAAAWAHGRAEPGPRVVLFGLRARSEGPLQTPSIVLLSWLWGAANVPRINSYLSCTWQ